MTEECARGQRRGWQEFARDYVPVTRALLGHYFPTLRPELDEHVRGVFGRARAEANAWFRGLQFANEREFLMAFRALAFGYARPLARMPAPELSVVHAQALLREFPTAQRAFVWMYVKGYDAAQTAAILMNADVTAAAALKTGADRLAQLVPGGRPDGPLTVLLEAAEKAYTPECLMLKTCNNLVNGQISWQDRDRAQQHMADCVHCVDRFTSFQEMIWYRREARPLGEAAVNALLGSLGLSPAKGMIGRLFSKSA